MLVNEHTLSAGEMVAAFANENGRARIVGTRTGGQVLGGANFSVGHGFTIRLPAAGWYTWSGSLVEGRGVTGRGAVLFWQIDPVAHTGRARIECISPFDARGLRRIYRRADHVPGHSAYHLDMWLTSDGHVLVRFSSRGSYVEDVSNEMHCPRIRRMAVSRMAEGEAFVLPVLRRTYEDWVIDRIEYPNE